MSTTSFLLRAKWFSVVTCILSCPFDIEFQYSPILRGSSDRRLHFEILNTSGWEFLSVQLVFLLTLISPRVRPHWLLTSIIESIFIVTSTWRCHMDSLLGDSLSCWSRLLRGFYRAVLSSLCFWHFALLSNELHSVLSQYYPTLRELTDRGLQFGSSEYLWKESFSMCS